MNATHNVLTSVDVLAATLAADGWRQATPPELASVIGVRAVRVDGNVALESTCDTCDNTGALYVPFVLSEPQPGRSTTGYRAFAVCRCCGEAREY